MKKPNSIHFVGIKGVGMTPLAIIAKEAGIAVTGSDIGEAFITDIPLRKAGITPLVGFDSAHVGDVDLVITTGAHGGYDNTEVKTAKEKGIPVMSNGEAVGAFMNGELLGAKYQGISVAGSHGKTTTAAIVATVLREAGKDPGYLIGTSEIPSLDGMPGHFGKGSIFVAEADEYATEPTHDTSPRFLHQHPRVAVVTNIEHDHPDIYPTLDDVRKAFLQFVRSLPENGILIICGDGEQAKLLLGEYSGPVCTYGFSPLNDYIISEYGVTDTGATFSVHGKGTDFGTFTLSVAGEHNALNAVGAYLAAREVGVSAEEAKTALRAFSGTKRRMEYKGTLTTGALVYDDYAHHPTEIKSSLKTIRNMYTEKAILCIFQPHTYSRTKELFSEFTQAFLDAASVVLLPIYASAREVPDESVSSGQLAEEIQKRQKNVFFFEKVSDVLEYIDKNRFGSDTVILTMGAGDVYKISEDLAFREKNDEYSQQASISGKDIT
jgi:UDP-N-acetylmuramate--alanine ligase